MIGITTHSIVKNEENWVWFSLMSAKDCVSEMLVVDDDSDDKTLAIIKTIKDVKLQVQSSKMKTAQAHTDMRNEMVKRTKTDWFLLLDGDEVWNRETLQRFIVYLATLGRDIYGVVMRTRNCVGDVYHYLPEGAGNYHLLDRKGHLTIRAFRKAPEFYWRGENWPLESYCDSNGRPINDQKEHLCFFDGFYWHLTHLPRSSSKTKVFGWRQTRCELGIPVTNPREFPEVFDYPRPEIVPSPWGRMSKTDYLVSAAVTPFKRLRRRIRYG